MYQLRASVDISAGLQMQQVPQPRVDCIFCPAGGGIIRGLHCIYDQEEAERGSSQAEVLLRCFLVERRVLIDLCNVPGLGPYLSRL